MSKYLSILNKSNKMSFKTMFYKHFKTIFSTKLIKFHKINYTTNIHSIQKGLVPYEEFAAVNYGSKFLNTSTYDLIKENFQNVSKNDDIFLNREDILKQIYDQMKKNFTYRKSNGTILRKDEVALINFGDNNGTGKTTLLNILPERIRYIEVSNETKKIIYPQLRDMIFTNSVIESFIRTIILALSPFFNENINDNIKYDYFTLIKLSKLISDYLSSDEMTSKTGWENLYKGFYNPDQASSYKHPNGEVIVFRIDEIGNLNTINMNEYADFTHEEEEIRKEYTFTNIKKLEKKNLIKLLRLYLIRKYIHKFCNSKIDVIVAGKNGFLPFMGRMIFDPSPSLIKTFSLKPFLNSNDLNLIFNFEITKNKINIYAHLSKLIKENTDKTTFNSLVDKLIEYLKNYTGGHPRLINTVLNMINEEKLDDYLKPDYNIDQRIQNLFNKIEKKLFADLNSDILTRMTKTTMMNIIADLVYEKSSMFNFLKTNPKYIYITLINSLNQDNSVDLSETSLEILLHLLPDDLKLTLKDIAISLGSPYFDISDKKIIVFIPKFLKNFIFKEIKAASKKEIKKIFLNPLYLDYKINGKIVEEVLIDYYYTCFINRIKEEMKIFNGYDHYLQKSNEIIKLEIKGSVNIDKNDDKKKLDKNLDKKEKNDENEVEKNTKNMIENKLKYEKFTDIISNQLIDAINENKNTSLIIKPLLPNHIAHDFYVIIPSNTNSNKIFITAVQVKTSKEKSLRMKMKDINLGNWLIEEIANKITLEKKYECSTKYLILSNCQTINNENPPYFVTNDLMKDIEYKNKNTKSEHMIARIFRIFKDL